MKHYIYRNSKTFSAIFVSDNKATNVVLNNVTSDEEYYITVDSFCSENHIEKRDFDIIAKTISIKLIFSPKDGRYWLNKNQWWDMHNVVFMFLNSNIPLSKDIKRAIKSGKFILVDKLPDDTKNDENELKQDDYEKYNKSKYVDTVRRRNKKQIKKKFVVGKKYFLRVHSTINSDHIYKIYELKKFIYSINNKAVNVVIMKRLNQPDNKRTNTMFTLNKADCAKYHIKYESGLQVLPMELNWCPVNENSVKFKEFLGDE